MKEKILFLVHGHPEISKGGGEVAAWNLCQAFKNEGHETLFLARVEGPSHGGSSFSVHKPGEMLLHSHITDWFNLSNANVRQLFTDFVDLVAHFKPDVVHIHHYASIGIEVFKAIRKAVPDAKVIFTIHEYMAICNHNGQMVKKKDLKLCYQSSPADCNRCFPEISPANFFLRQQFLLDQFSYVDQFISPSKFLKDRYVAWGLPEDKIEVIENVLPEIEQLAPRPLKEGEKRSKFAYFGQINPYKGLDVLLRALLLLPESVRETLTLEVHGANLDAQADEYKKLVSSLIEECGEMVTLRGPYESHQLPNLIAECDWVVMSSVWWENSPVVIQEAIAYGRPLIGADIGGMKEKIEGIAGLTFNARSHVSLANRILEAIEPKVFDKFVSKLSIENYFSKHQLILAE